MLTINLKWYSADRVLILQPAPHDSASRITALFLGSNIPRIAVFLSLFFLCFFGQMFIPVLN